MKKLKRFLVLLLALCLLAAMLPTVTLAATTASGTCGDNVTWSLNDSGKLTISGSGEMTNFASSTAVPWYNYRNDIEKVVINSGVTTVGDCAFSACNYLEKVTLPDGITYIGRCAFGGTSSGTAISDITIPDSVRTIGSYAFSWCESLNSIIIPDGVSVIDACTFQNCKYLRIVTIPDSVTSIGWRAFYNCSNIYTVKYGGTMAQWNQISINATGNVYLKSAANFQTVAPVSLVVLSLPAKTTYQIGETLNTSGLVLTATYPNGSTEEVTSGFTVSGFDSTTVGVKEVTVSYNNCSTTILLYVVDNGTFGDGFHWQLDENGTLTISGTGPMPDFNGGGASYSDAPWSQHSLNISNLVIEEGITTIGKYAFYKCSGLKRVTIPDSVTSIGYESFYDCQQLESVQLGNGLVSIGYGAFRYSNLSSIEIPDSVTSVGETAFSSSNNLTSVSLGKGIKSIGYYAFYDCGNLEKVYYSGDEAERGKITIGSLNTPLTDAVWHYNICGGDRTTVHSYEWVMDQENTCGVDGIKHEECTVCRAKRSENTVIAATADHLFLANGTCEKCGNKISLSITDSDGNQIGEYTSVSEALRAATEGQTLSLQADATDTDVILPSGVNLDLNGHSLTADSVLSYSGGAIIDTSEDVSGLLKITDPDGNMISVDNAQLPVYDNEAGGYRFFAIDVEPCAVTGGSKYWFKVKAEKFAPLYELIQADADVQIEAKLTWDGQTEDVYAAADLSFTKSWADRYNANEDIYITVSVTEADGLENFRLIPIITSGGVEIPGEEM